MKEMTVVGLTGGTGAGKTTALNVLRDRGALIIDCDEVYHELLESSAPMMAELRERFPGAFAEDGRFDRKALGRIVFQDEAAMLELNRVTHKYVDREVERRLTGWRGAGGRLAAVDAIALIESGLGERCDVRVAVTAPADIRAKRIAAREGITMEYALMRIRAQKPDSFFEESCDHVLVNDCDTLEEFQLRCAALFDNILGGKNMDREKLFYTKKNAWDGVDQATKLAIHEYCEDYKAFLDAAKTEREAVKTAVALAEAKGFRAFRRGEKLVPGDKIYCNNRGKALMLAVIGKKPLDQGANIAAAHIDSPRLDLKQQPIYEDSEICMSKTHYYGGIKKYQWVTIPLAIHGVVVKADGEKVDVCIGEEAGDPILLVTDLLPHLGKDQGKKSLDDAFTGENLNILLGSVPVGDPKESERVKLGVLQLLNEKYGVTEEDLISAELTAVPAAKARDVGLDRSLIGAYGHDDRSCAYAELRAILDTEEPEHTAVCVLADKEEIGSEGVSGMQSQAFECFMADLCESQGVAMRHCFAASFCLSADVCNAYDPNYPEVSEKRNNAQVNYGMGLIKFTGARGKSGSSDASAEIIGDLRRIFSEENVVWQMGELGKVDQGGGGTVAMYMANRNIDTIDAGVPVLSMHAPYEVVSKLDCYMTYKGVKAVYDKK